MYLMHLPYAARISAPWINDEAFVMLPRLADTKFDRDCVGAMLKNADKILEIQQRFCDEEVV